MFNDDGVKLWESSKLEAVVTATSLRDPIPNWGSYWYGCSGVIPVEEHLPCPP